MPIIRCTKDRFRGTVLLPASKSISNRLLILQGLTGHDLELENLSPADDTQLLQQCLHNISKMQRISVDNAGTVARFMTAFLAISQGEWVLTGNDRMLQRPIGPLVDALRQCGAAIDYKGASGYLPLQIHGCEMMGGEVSLAAGISSQFASALLMVAPKFKEGLCLHLLPPVASGPYLEMTIGLMQACGLAVKPDGLCVTVEPSTVQARRFVIENDWSAASFFYALASFAHGSHLILPGLSPLSLQGDAVLVEWYRELGVESSFDNTGVSLRRVREPNRELSFDFSQHPDLFLPMAMACAGNGCAFTAKGVHNLRHKESDRLTAVARGLQALGFSVEFDGANFRLEAGCPWQESRPAPLIDVCEDHRLAMSFALLAVRFPEIRINRSDVVSKSFPGFFTRLAALGFSITDNIQLK